MKCPNCNAQIAAGSKFCVYCGKEIIVVNNQPFNDEPQKESDVSSEGKNKPFNIYPAQGQSSEAGKAGRVSAASSRRHQEAEGETNVYPKKKGGSKWILVVIVVLVIGIRGCFWLATSVDSGQYAEEESGVEVNASTEDIQDGGSEPQNSGASSESDAQERDESTFDDTDKLSILAQEEYEEEAYTDAHRDSKQALQNYLQIAGNSNLGLSAQERIANTYKTYTDAIISYGKVLENQDDHLASVRYETTKDMIDSAHKLTNEIVEKGYEVDSNNLENYANGLIGRYKDFYIRAINKFANSEETGTPWPRDDAWKYASSAYSVQINGEPVLFDETNLEDPLRMRYVYCLAWITTKRCEQGINEGTMNASIAAGLIKGVLEETDYNPLLLQKYIGYAREAGLDDADRYQRAYDAIIDEVKREQDLIIELNTGENSGNRVDLRYFRYFNNLNGEEKYLVDSTNGTTKATRDWIRNNIPEMLK